MRHEAMVEFLTIDQNYANFLLLRASSRMVQGADTSSSTRLGSSAEYYSVALNFDARERNILPQFTLDNPKSSRMVVNPVTRTILPEFTDGPKRNEKFFFSSGTNVFWRSFGRIAYAYADAIEWKLRYVKYNGERCAIDLPSDVKLTDERNNRMELLLSNDGEFVAISKFDGEIREVDVFQGCAKVAHHRVDLPKRSQLEELCVAEGKYWYLFSPHGTSDYSAFEYGSDIAYQLKESMLRTDGIPGAPVFDCRKRKFYWTTDPRDTNKDRGTALLHRFDPVMNKMDGVKLYLGKPLY